MSNEDNTGKNDKYKNTIWDRPLNRLCEDRTYIVELWMSRKYEDLKHALKTITGEIQDGEQHFIDSDYKKHIMQIGMLSGAAYVLNELMNELETIKPIEGLKLVNQYLCFFDNMSVLETIARKGSITDIELRRDFDIDIDSGSNSIRKFLDNISLTDEVIGIEAIVEINKIDDSTTSYRLTDTGKKFVECRNKQMYRLFNLVREVFGDHHDDATILSTMYGMDIDKKGETHINAQDAAQIDASITKDKAKLLDFIESQGLLRGDDIANKFGSQIYESLINLTFKVEGVGPLVDDTMGCIVGDMYHLTECGHKYLEYKRMRNSIEAYKQCIELAKNVNEEQLNVLRLWLNGDIVNSNKTLLKLQMDFGKLIDQLSGDELHEAMIQCGKLKGTTETIERLLYERNRDTEISRIVDRTYTSTYMLGVKDSILEFIYNKGVVSNKDIQESLGYDDHIIDFCMDDYIECNKPLVTRGYIGGNTFTFSLTDYGIRYMKYTKDKKADLARLIREVYGGIDDNFEEITDKQIDNYLNNIGKVEKSTMELKQPIKSAVKSARICGKAVQKVISNRLGKDRKDK